jgi:hypothetical protein
MRYLRKQLEITYFFTPVNQTVKDKLPQINLGRLKKLLPVL